MSEPKRLSRVRAQAASLVILSFLSLLFAPPVLAQDAQSIDALVKDTLNQWRVPGLALAIVHNDRVIYLKGHGVRELGRPESVSADTNFPLASCTKPFTSLAVAMLVGDGKMAWDEPVRKHVPFFHLADPLADADVTIRDLLCHRTGVGGHELLWYKAPWGLEERIRKIGKVELEDSFRTRFHYQTILFGAAGYAAGNAAGSDWGTLVQRRILEPLGMKASKPIFPRDAPDQASPHRQNARGKVEPIARYPLDQADPAGSLHASARDLTRFLRFELGDGTWQGQRLLPAEVLHERQRPQMVIRREGFAEVMNPVTVQISYGLGWILQDYRGRLLLQHGGAIDGFRAHLSLVPEAKVGIALLNNLDRGFMNLALSNILIDHLLGLPYRDWNAYYLDIQTKDQANEKERSRLLRADRKPGAKPSLPLPAYAGKFTDTAYGTCTITVDKGLLNWSWGDWHCPLEYLEEDTFVANAEGLVDGSAEFRVEGNQVVSVKIIGRVFRRVDLGK